MSDHGRTCLQERLRVLVPFGLASRKPRHFTYMLRAAWNNRGNLPYAWKVLSRGVCDGCSLGVAGFHDWTIDGVHLCMTRLNLMRLNTMPAMREGMLDDVSRLRRIPNERLRNLGRLAFPMLRTRGERGFRRITWDDAIGSIAAKIRASGPKRIAFYLTSRGITNEVYYVAQKVARFLGTNSIDNAARLCHSPSTGAMKTAIGVAATTCSYRDWFGTDLIVFFGSNPANDQPVAMKYLEKAKKLGTKVVLVNPYREPGMMRYWVPSSVKSAVFGTKIVDEWFGVAHGGDIAFLYGVIRTLTERGWVDENFITNHTDGFAQLRAQAELQDWATLESQVGLPRGQMEMFASMIRDARTAVLVWSMGITQHAFGADTVRMILNLGLLKGYVGRERCGLMPIRGHSGVQGGAEMGAYSTGFPGGKPINTENAAALSSTYGFAVPDKPGLLASEMVEAGARGALDMLYCVGGNFLRTLPDSSYVERALENVPLRVHQDVILTDQMLIDAKDEVILLPARTRYEQEGGCTQTTTERRVIFSPEIPRQVGEARSEWRILRDLASAVDPERAKLLGCDTAQAIREEIARVVPIYDGIQNLHRIGDSFQYGGEHLCAGWEFAAPGGKAHFGAVPLPQRHRVSGEFFVSTRRGKQFNTLIYSEFDPLNGAPRDAILINPDDAAAMHIINGQRITLVHGSARYDGRAFFAPIATGNLQIHWPEGNVLIPRGPLDPSGGVPDFNCVVRIEHHSS
jgi:molybdopterin-dependent oxidoreductase alpha subunit